MVVAGAESQDQGQQRLVVAAAAAALFDVDAAAQDRAEATNRARRAMKGRPAKLVKLSFATAYSTRGAALEGIGPRVSSGGFPYFTPQVKISQGASGWRNH